MEKVFEILECLSDGRAHSGETLAAAFGVTRAAVWNRVQRLQDLGVEIEAVSGKGYRLAVPFEALRSDVIESYLSVAARRALRVLRIERVTNSTNQQLLERASLADIHGEVLLAEFQTAGRGRRGDAWRAPPGSGVCLSLGWRFDSPPNTMSALSLVIGLAVARAVRDLNVANVGVKWPNDVLHVGRKLAGILIEMRAEYAGSSTVVIGVGINCDLAAAVRAGIPQPVTDLRTALGASVSRNAVAAALVERLLAALQAFQATGFAPLMTEWRAFDVLDGHVVDLMLPDRTVSGTARGVDANGMLLVEHGGERVAYMTGHVRLADAP